MSPYKMSGATVVSFSGGRTSAYMLRQVLDNNDDHSNLLVLFANTGKEHPATLAFVQDVTDFWNAQPFDLMLPTINGRTLEGNCDLCFLKGANQVYSIIASDRGEPIRKGEWWARMERTAVSSSGITGNGALFRFDRPSYQQMLDYSEIQYDMFADHEETIACFCGD